MQAGQVHARVQQQRHAGVQHVGHGRVDPFHRGTGARRPVGGPVGELAAHGPLGAKGDKAVADLRARERAVMLHTRKPLQRPAQRLHQLARQAKGQVKAAHPGTRHGQPAREAVERVKRFQAPQLHPRRHALAQRQHDGLAPARAAGEIAAQQQGWFGHIGRHGLWSPIGEAGMQKAAAPATPACDPKKIHRRRKVGRFA